MPNYRASIIFCAKQFDSHKLDKKRKVIYVFSKNDRSLWLYLTEKQIENNRKSFFSLY